MEKSEKIFVAGHRGLVGSAIVRRLGVEGCANLLTATREQLDLRDQAAVNYWFRANRPEFVFLVAGTVGGTIAHDRQRTLREPAAQQNPRFGKRLDDEIYVASEASATPLRSYAPQSNFSPLQRVAPPWTPGIQMLSSPDFPLPAGLRRGIRPNGRTATKHLISDGISS